MRRNTVKLRKRIGALALIFGMGIAVGLLGCKTNTVTAPLAPGYQNSADQKIGQTLAGANWFYTSVQCSTLGQGFSQTTHACDPTVAVQKYTPAAAEKTALNELSLAINTANAIYLQYHNGQATLQQAQDAVNNVSAKQTSAEAVVPQSVGVR